MRSAARRGNPAHGGAGKQSHGMNSNRKAAKQKLGVLTSVLSNRTDAAVRPSGVAVLVRVGVVSVDMILWFGLDRFASCNED
jgi:hypothetical protein